jgi:myo-inositol-1(or 4)-monophosphatase
VGPSVIVPERNSAQDFEPNEPLRRIQSALDASREVFVRFRPGKIEAEYKARHNLVTEADRAIDALLRQHLLREGEGWLSEESADDRSRLGKARVWVVDPLDGTLEFVAGIPEFCTSVALVDNGHPVAGGIYNPATNQFFLGSLGTGVTLNGAPVTASRKDHLQGALILCSRSETKRGEWKQFEHAPFRVQPTGSVAYKLALVAAGLADAMFTLRPKHEWDVAAGVALVEAAAGFVAAPDGAPLSFNRPLPRLPGLLACGMSLRDELLSLINTSRPVRARRP